MIERVQFDMGMEAQRVAMMRSQGFQVEDRKAYVERQIITDIGERLDRDKSHTVYELKDGKMYAQGFREPFAQVIQGGIIQDWEGSREQAELSCFEFIESYMSDSSTPDGASVVYPSSPDGQNYKKNYLDVATKVGKEVHINRYRSFLSNQEYRERIVALNPAYEGVLPENPTDLDFFLNPVVVPGYLDISPDNLADFILDGRKGMEEREFQRIIAENIWIITSTANTLVEKPEALSEHETNQRALYAGVMKSKDGTYQPKFNIPKIEIEYLAGEPERIGGGGCGSGSCSTNGLSGSSIAETFSPDGKGPLEFNCPSCGAKNTRPYGEYVYRCQNGNCKNPEAVLPPALRNSATQGTKLLQ